MVVKSRGSERLYAESDKGEGGIAILVGKVGSNG